MDVPTPDSAPDRSSLGSMSAVMGILALRQCTLLKDSFRRPRLRVSRIQRKYSIQVRAGAELKNAGHLGSPNAEMHLLYEHTPKKTKPFR